MRTITLQEAKKRTGFELLNDTQIHFFDYDLGRSGTVSQGQNEMARKYPLHGKMIDAGKKYFAERGYEIYPRGVTVNGVGACPDFALFKGNKIYFVECLTAVWADRRNI